MGERFGEMRFRKEEKRLEEEAEGREGKRRRRREGGNARRREEEREGEGRLIESVSAAGGHQENSRDPSARPTIDPSERRRSRSVEGQ